MTMLPFNRSAATFKGSASCLGSLVTTCFFSFTSLLIFFHKPSPLLPYRDVDGNHGDLFSVCVHLRGLRDHATLRNAVQRDGEPGRTEPDN
jgi:hypothetical protein